MKKVIAWILLSPALLLVAMIMFLGLVRLCESWQLLDQVLLGIIALGIVGYLMLLSAWRKEDRELQ